PADGYDSPIAAWDAYQFDRDFRCNTRTFLRAWAAKGLEARGYIFDHTPNVSFFPAVFPVHGSELWFVFGTAPSRARFTSAEATFATTFQQMWTSVAGGTPTLPGGAAWPFFGQDTFVHLEAGAGGV